MKTAFIFTDSKTLKCKYADFFSNPVAGTKCSDFKYLERKYKLYVTLEPEI